MQQTLPDLVDALLKPSAYPERPHSVAHLQTHISHVFLAGRSVYKLKKPVNFGFLDFSSAELRRASCLEEVRLNRRLSPDVYLGVVPVTERDGRIQIGGDGEPIDWTVHMRRLPAEQMLETLIRVRAVPAGSGRRLGEILGRFHLSADRSEAITTVGGRSAVEGNWRENFQQVRPFRGRTIEAITDDRIQAYVSDFLEQEGPLLAERDASGFIRDLHGDLRSAQIWLLDQPPKEPSALTPKERALLAWLDGVRILDCIEFNERLRCCDTASDIGFLAMDLVFRGAAALARELTSRYLEVTSDSHLPLLLDFYCCYRAYVRGKVDSLGLTEREMGGSQRRSLVQRARRFFRLAARYAGAAHARQLIVMMGVSGSGKSHLGRLIALDRRAALISSDVTRKGLMELAATSDAGSAAYTAEQTERTYAALLDQAEQELRRHHAVVLDATFLLARQRVPALELARRLGVPFSLVWCRAIAAQIEDRLRLRQHDPYRVSDASGSIVEAQLDHLEPPRELPHRSVIQADTSKPNPALLGRIRRQLA